MNASNDPSNDPSNDRPGLHPVVWAAAVSVIVASMVAVAAMTGLLPKSRAEATSSTDAAVTASATTPPAATATPNQTQVADIAAQPRPHKVVAHQAARAPREEAAVAPPQPVQLARADLPPPAPNAAPVCNDCGIVESVHQVNREGSGTGLGAVAGGVIGGALGNGVGQGNGRALATLAGIVGGAFAGNKIEKSTHQTTHYEIVVRFNDGSTRLFTQESAPPWREGDHVRVANGALTYDS